MKKLVEIRTALFPEQHPAVADSLFRIGIAYFNIGRGISSIPYLRKALEIRKSLFSGPHPDIATTVYILGYIHNNLGEKEKAIEFYS